MILLTHLWMQDLVTPLRLSYRLYGKCGNRSKVMSMNISNAIQRTREHTLDSPLVWIIMGTILGLIACKLT